MTTVSRYLLISAAALFFTACDTPKQVTVCSETECALCKEEVQKRLGEIAGDIGKRLAAFAAEVALDQQFSLRLIAEDNRSAPEVTGKAGQFMKPMGFSVLSIVDSVSVILSSGDFPASTGNSVLAKAALLSAEPKFMVDQVVEKNVLTLQAKSTLTIVDGIPVHAIGGLVVDEAFLARLSPRSGVVVLLKQGKDVTGMPGVRTITEIKDGKIMINDKEYGAFQIDLPFAGEGEPPVLIGIVKQEPSAAGKG